MLALSSGIAARSAAAASAGLAGLGWLVLIGRRLLLRIDDESIESRGWVSRGAARWDDIHSITNSAHLPWPRDRWFGPLVFEVSASSGRFRVNFLYFGPQAFRAFRSGIKQHQIRTSSNAHRGRASNEHMQPTAVWRCGVMRGHPPTAADARS